MSRRLFSFLIYLMILALLTQCQAERQISYAPDAQVIVRIEGAARGIAKDQGFDYICWGQHQILDIVPPKDLGAIWVISLMDRRSLTKDQAREVILDIYDDYKSRTLNNPDFHADYQIYLDLQEKTAFEENKMGIKLAFWDKNVDRPLCPYVAQVRLALGEIKYFYVADSTQRLGEPEVESIETAYSLSQKNRR